MKTQLLFLLLLLYQSAIGQSVVIDANPASSSLIAINSDNKSLLTPRITSTQRSAIANPTAGLMVYDTTTNSYWYFNGTNWGEMSIFSVYNYWQINGANQHSEGSSSVGINIFAAKAKFQIAANQRTQAIFGSASAGISLIANNPAIGFNIYNDNTNTNRHLTTGYGFLQEFKHTKGEFSFTPLAYRNKDSSALQTNASYYLTELGQFGKGFFASNSPQTRFFNSDFSKLGENAPEIKCRLYTGTTENEENYNPNTGQYEYERYTSVHLLMPSFKILKISIVIECGGSRPYVQPNQCGDSFYGRQCYRYFLDNNGFLIIVHEGAASLDTYSKPYKVFVTYIR